MDWPEASGLIQRYESGGRNIKNPTSSAFGPWQIIDSTWRSAAPGVGIDLAEYPTAAAAPVPVQEKVAESLYQRGGFSDWAPYNPRLASAVRWQGKTQTTIHDPELGRDVPYVRISKAPDEELPPMLFLDGLLGGSRPGADDEGAATGEPNPLAFLDGLLAPPPAAQQMAEEAQPIEQVVVPQAMPVVPMQEPIPPPPPTRQVGPQAQPAAAPQAPLALLDKLLGAVNPIGAAQAGQIVARGDLIEPPAAGASTPLPALPTGPTAPPETGMRRFFATSAEALSEAPAGIAKGAGQFLDTLLGLGERVGLGMAAGETGQPMPEATTPLGPGLRAAGGALDFATGGLLNPLSMGARGAATTARAVGGEVERGVPGALADARGGRPPRGTIPPVPGGPSPPGGPSAGGAPPVPPSRISEALRNSRKWADEAIRDVQIKAVPMAAGDDAGRAVAKDYASLERLARWRRSSWDRDLRKLSPADQKAMWEAMDNASVAAQADGYDAGLKYLTVLPRNQQRLIQEMENHGIELWQQAKDAGLVTEDAKRLPFYVMRGIVEVAEDGQISRVRAGGGGGMSNIDQFGVNLTDRGPMGRSYLTTEETEAAARRKFGEGAEAVRNIRVLPMAYERFERAIAGRRLINDLKEIGEATRRPAVVAGEKAGYFTVDHPMFKTYQPRMGRNAGETGVLLDEAGRPIIDRVPLYIDKRFEGPLRSIARSEAGVTYSALMQIKAASMATIMNSPAIHNMVEWGRALGAMPGKVGTFKIYGIGARALQDKALMERAIKDGFVPTGERGYMQDIEGIASATDLQPGRGLLAKGAGALTDIVSPQAGDAVRRGIDRAGDFWHQTLLWDQVAKLQAGLYTEFNKEMIGKGVDPDVASKMAAHWANRFAGAVPNEAMSEQARKWLNFALFSRSFTMGNLGVMKDMVNGLPRDVRAQIGRDLTAVEQKASSSLARRKAIGVVMVDVGIALAANAILQSALNVMRGDKTLDEEGQDYARRLSELMERTRENPLSALNPLSDIMALSPTHENEPGKGERVRVGHADDGTAIYGRSPVGKIGEEFAGWFMHPRQMLRNKMGTIVRPILNTIANDRGFGQRVFNEDPHGIGDVVSLVGDIAWEFIRSQGPEMQLQAARRLLTGRGDKIDVAQAVAPFLGITISRGAPGGEAVGELYQARGQHETQVKEALPKVKQLVKDGKADEAEQMLDELGVPLKLRNYYIRIYTDPSARLSRGAMKQFERSATPEQKERMQRQLDRPRTSVSGP